MATATSRSRFYYPLLSLGAVLLIVSLLVAIVGGTTRPALYIFAVASVVIVVANAREWQHKQHNT